MLRWLSILLACCGCSKGDQPVPVAVSGDVSFEGKPVTQGVVLFMSDQGFGASAEIDSQGHYVIRSQYGKGIPAGTYRISVTPPPEAVHESDIPARSSSREMSLEIPKKYRDFSTSGLEIQLGEKSMTYDIPLTTR